MPITELIAPGFKQDDATREAYSFTVLPYLVKIVTGRLEISQSTPGTY
jgi:hypothetical protein